jgi:hypothetical protein
MCECKTIQALGWMHVCVGGKCGGMGEAGRQAGAAHESPIDQPTGAATAQEPAARRNLPRTRSAGSTRFGLPAVAAAAPVQRQVVTAAQAKEPEARSASEVLHTCGGAGRGTGFSGINRRVAGWSQPRQSLPPSARSTRDFPKTHLWLYMPRTTAAWSRNKSHRLVPNSKPF